MEELRKEIKNHQIFSRWQILKKTWDSHFSEVDALLIRDGVEDDNVIKFRTIAFQSWFYKFELINTITILSRDTLIFYGNKDKIDLLAFLKDDAAKHYKTVVFVEKRDKDSGSMEQLYKELEKLKVNKFGIFKREVQKGKMIDQFNERFQKHAKFTETDISKSIQEILSIKEEIDILSLKKAAKTSCFYFKKFIDIVEEIIDQNKKFSHLDISRIMEDKLLKLKPHLKSKLSIIPGFFDYSYTPVVQSGKEYVLGLRADNNDDNLEFNIILLNLAGKYFEMNCNIYRTLLIDPDDQDQKNYNALYWLHNDIIKSLKLDKTLANVYTEVKKRFSNKYPSLKNCLRSDFGFGIGYEFRESVLLISPKNKRVVKVGNVFMVHSGLNKLKNKKGHEYSMQISDTVLVTANGKIQNLTSEIGSNFDIVGYDLNEDKTNDNKNGRYNNDHNNNHETSPILPKKSRSELRRQKMIEEQSKNSIIKNNQKRLLDIKMDELKNRIESGNFGQKESESNKVNLEKLVAYPSGKIPKYGVKHIHLDQTNQTVLFPINNKLIPFHISCIKNITKHQENQFISLRINFQTPTSSSGNLVFPMLKSYGTTPIYLKELSFRTTDIEGIMSIAKQIKDTQKKFKLNMSLNKKYMKQVEKEVLRNKLKSLSDLKMRPTLTGRKTIGHLTAYSNGFKYVSKRNEIFTLMLSNIKHALYQPWDHHMIVILHFVLKNPLVVNKKLTHHIQFYAEVGLGTEDLHDPRKKRMSGYDDFEDEERLEQQTRDHFNNLFLNFIEHVQSNWESNLKFDIPFKELGFYGSPFYNNVFIMPTAFCLIALIEKPFLVIMLEDIELVSIERIDNKTKNFDLILVFKNFSRPVQTLDNIPKENLADIKEWLNNENILFFEGGSITLKWNNLLKKIVSDPKDFLDEGGWRVFAEESDHEQNDDDQDDGDSEFDEEDAGDEEEEDDLDLDEELYEEDSDAEEFDEEEEDDEYDYSEEEPKKRKKRKK